MTTPLDPKLAGFNLIQANYTNHAIRADFLIPKTVSARKKPVIVRFHGGRLVSHQKY